MDRKTYAVAFAFLAFICLPLSFSTGCGGSSSSSSTPPSTPFSQVVQIAATSGSSQSAASGKTFSGPLTATVTLSGAKTAGVAVTFTAPASGASGTFANGTATETDITNDLGVATSSTLTANTTAGTYSVQATASGASSPVTFSLTNVAVTAYSFYVSGEDSNSAYYALAGAIVVDSNGNVLGGEQDYNDGSAGINSPQPKGDQITGGTLAFPAGAPAGQATLTLNTNNSNLGLNADQMEIFGVQFVNSNHALIMQFDGFATSSGSMDTQTLPSTLSGSYAFALSGTDANGSPDAYGGVFSISGGTLSSGTLDVNDSASTGAAVINTPFSGTVTPADSYGRGTIKGLKVSGTAVTLNYYVVGPEAIRLIDVDKTDSAAGSAFGQGAGTPTLCTGATFCNASLGQSVFALAGNVLAQYGALGQFTTSNTTSSPADFAGSGDDTEPPNGVFTPDPEHIAGTYSIASNGYGSLTFSVTNTSYVGLGDITALGIYMTDPALNLEDPNNTTGGGGALVVDLDDGTLVGVALPGLAGVIVPQTDTAADINGVYAAAWQNFNDNGCSCEFDMIAQGTMVAGAPGSLSLTGLISDPFLSLTQDSVTQVATTSGDTFIGAPLADTVHLNTGRYTMQTTRGSLATTIGGVANPPNFYMTIYQASDGQLFWLDYDKINQTTVSLGPLEEQGSLTGLPAAKKRTATSSSGKR